MKSKRILLGIMAMFVTFAFNFHYARQSYGVGIAYADSSTAPPNHYECDTDGEGHVVMCDSRMVPSIAYITCPYYIKKCFVKIYNKKLNYIGIHW